MTDIPVFKTKYVTTKQICEHFGISKATLWRWRKHRDFPQIALNGKPNRWLLTDIEQWETNQHKATIAC